MTIQTPDPVVTSPTPAAAAVPAPDTTLTEPVVKPAEVAAPKTDPPAPKTPDPKPIELKLPEGSLFAPETVAKVAARAKEQNLTPEQAQAELNRESDLVKSFVEGEKIKLAKEANSWVEASKVDPEIGGEKYAANAEVAKRVVNRFGTEAFKKALNDSGLGNHPELVRVFVRIGRAMTDDQLVLSNGVSTAPRSAAETLYGEPSKENKL